MRDLCVWVSEWADECAVCFYVMDGYTICASVFCVASNAFLFFFFFWILPKRIALCALRLLTGQPKMPKCLIQHQKWVENSCKFILWNGKNDKRADYVELKMEFLCFFFSFFFVALNRLLLLFVREERKKKEKTEIFQLHQHKRATRFVICMQMTNWIRNNENVKRN